MPPIRIAGRSAYTEDTFAHQASLAAAMGKPINVPGIRVAWQGYSNAQKTVDETMSKVLMGGLQSGDIFFEAPDDTTGSYLVQLVQVGEMEGRYPQSITPRCRHFVVPGLPMELAPTMAAPTESDATARLKAVLAGLSEAELAEALEYATSARQKVTDVDPPEPKVEKPTPPLPPVSDGTQVESTDGDPPVEEEEEDPLA